MAGPPADPRPGDASSARDVRDLYDHAPCGLLLTAADGLVLQTNQTFLDWTGYASDDLVGRRHFIDLLSAGGRIFHETHYAPQLRLQGAVREIALQLVLADGTRLPVLVNAVTDPDDPAGVIRLVVMDATERRSYEQELLQAKVRAEQAEARARSLTRTLQQTLIPPSPPRIPGLEVAAAYHAAGGGETEVGGDFYDVFAVGRDEWVVVLGDVCGKGVEAAVVTALVRHTVRALSVEAAPPSRMLAGLNEVLCLHATEKFCTLVILRLSRVDTGWVVQLGAGGHPPTYLVPERGSLRTVVPVGPLVGIDETAAWAEWQDVELRLGEGDVLAMYTDGVTEARRGREQYGEERLAAALSRLRGEPHQLVAGLATEVLEFQGGHLRDDVAILALGVPATTAGV